MLEVLLCIVVVFHVLSSSLFYASDLYKSQYGVCGRYKNHTTSTNLSFLVVPGAKEEGVGQLYADLVSQLGFCLMA